MVNAKEFLEKFIKLTGEVTNLHGRRELSKDGYELMRNMLREAMDGLGTKNEVHGPDPVKKSAPTGTHTHYHGYLRSDVLAARATGSHMRLDQYRFNEDDTVSFRRGLNGDEWVALGDFKDGPAFANWERDARRLCGLRRPHEPDYKPLA